MPRRFAASLGRALIRHFGWLVAGLVVGGWWLATAASWVSPAIVPGPSAVARAARRAHTELLSAVGLTARDAAIAAGISLGLGVLLGCVAGAVKRMGWLRGVLSSAFALPSVLLYPMLAIWVGYGSGSKIAFGAFLGTIPIALNCAAAVGNADPGLRMTLKSSGPTTWQSLRMYWIPTIVPGIVVGCQVGLVGALSGVIVGEMLIGTGGVGEFIAEQRDQFNIAEMYSGIVSVCLMAIILTAAIRILARRTQRFQGA